MRRRIGFSSLLLLLLNFSWVGIAVGIPEFRKSVIPPGTASLNDLRFTFIKKGENTIHGCETHFDSRTGNRLPQRILEVLALFDFDLTLTRYTPAFVYHVQAPQYYYVSMTKAGENIPAYIPGLETVYIVERDGIIQEITSVNDLLPGEQAHKVHKSKPSQESLPSLQALAAEANKYTNRIRLVPVLAIQVLNRMHKFCEEHGCFQMIVSNNYANGIKRVLEAAGLKAQIVHSNEFYWNSTQEKPLIILQTNNDKPEKILEFLSSARGFPFYHIEELVFFDDKEHNIQALEKSIENDNARWNAAMENLKIVHGVHVLNERGENLSHLILLDKLLTEAENFIQDGMKKSSVSHPNSLERPNSLSSPYLPTPCFSDTYPFWPLLLEEEKKMQKHLEQGGTTPDPHDNAAAATPVACEDFLNFP